MALKIQLLSEKAKDNKDNLYYPDKNLLKVFLGPSSKLTDFSIRKTLSNIDWKSLTESKVELDTGSLNDEQALVANEIIQLKSFIFDEYRTKHSKDDKHTNITKISLDKKIKNLKERNTIIDSIKFCRNIVSQNASEINPGQMERFAKELAAKNPRIKVRVINHTQAAKKNMGCLLAVGAESIANSPKDFHPRLVVLEYTAGEKVDNHIALVGKGITFDTGGLCLKPTNYMLDMKSDMAGSATVLATFHALAHLPNSFVKNGTKVTGVLALAENGFGASSYKPGDVLTAMNGTSVQVVDTDAEGRLALADALCYASSQKPDQIIDLATLTGSVVASLGEAAAGAMTNDEELLATLKASFDTEGENIWQMPLFDEYKDIIKSEIADIAHCNTRPDASVAGIFLKEFVGDKSGKQIPWVHLDIAGMGWFENDRLWAYAGATGFGIKSLLSHIKSV